MRGNYIIHPISKIPSIWDGKKGWSAAQPALNNFPDNMYARDFTISPNGKKLVMDVTYQMYSENDPADLYILDLETGDLKPFITGAARPTWSPHAIKLPSAALNVYIPFMRR